MTGAEVAKDLASHLRGGGWLVWTQMPLGSMQMDHVPIVDVLALKKSYRSHAVIYEVKVTRVRPADSEKRKDPGQRAWRTPSAASTLTPACGWGCAKPCHRSCA